MHPQLKKVAKRILLRTVKPPAAATVRFFQMVMALEDDDESGTPREFHSTGEYLVYWHQRILKEVDRAFGKVVVPGSSTARPQYVWGLVNGAYLARALGIPRVSVLEFGVAGGNGLVALEAIAERVTGAFGVDIDVYGFDTGKGCPKPLDYRDTPNLFQEGGYPIDPDRLRARLRRAELILGLVESTVPEFIERRPAPIAFAAFDMGLYSATSKGLHLFCAPGAMLLPRVQCYFGSVMGHTYSDFTADRLAIAEFNAGHDLRKIAAYGMDVVVPHSHAWAGRMYIAHFFDHALYGVDDGMIKVRDNPLRL